ncbi:MULTISPECIES: DUF6635 family protein [unclassified Yoonia]|uniref:DUF6635 family protein n=1 Tax=unclassified Yoonia TaxID=2629118 RepID=UPI002AFF6E05|nr:MULTISPECIES: DUF6635 family protein [unclassified Yoonia]
MVSSSHSRPRNAAVPHAYFTGLRHQVDGFVGRYFTWPGTFWLHASACGWDILRAPLNVMLAPIFLLTRLMAYIFRRLGFRRIGQWFARRRTLLRTAVARRVEALIVTDLLGLPLDADAAARDPSALARAVLAAPQFREMIRQRPDPAAAAAVGQRIATALADYASTRSAVADMTTALCTIAVGALVFNALTPGMISMAPGVADALAWTTAVTQFPLGESLGGVWYGMFRPGASPVLVGLTVAVLIMIGSIFAAFAGILADPVQSRLGIHRRRLLRLIDTLEVELTASGSKPFVAREHLYARVLDIWDAIASLLRVFRP